MKWCVAACALMLAACTRPTQPEITGPWFADVAAGSGIQFTHLAGASGQFYMPEIMGSGCALLDYDNDGDLDVLLIQGAPGGSGNRLFRNDLIPAGKLQFTDVTREARLDRSGHGMGAAAGDFNNDGRLDLLVTYFGRNVLYRNNGDGAFADVTSESPAIALPGRWSTSAAFVDYDRDGWLDLVILNYIDYSFESNKRCYAPTGELDYCTPKAYRSLPAHLFHNERGKFVDVTARSGLTRAAGPGLGVVALDANRDGWPDLFVANDSSANHLWINQKDGTFKEQALESGVAYGADGLAKAGMGVASGDYDSDGDEDLLVLNLMREGATLFQNSGAGNFTDVSLATGIHALTFAFTGFGVGWLDVDRDGWLDLFLANGAVTLREEQRGQPRPFQESNLLLRNPGTGQARFEDVSSKAGAALAPLGVTRGAAFGDIDNDGDIDILLNVNNGAARLLRNDLPSRNWLAVQLDGPRLGAGASVELTAHGLPKQTRWVHTDGSYMSASAGRVYFGLADAAGIEALTIRPPDGPAKMYAGDQVKINSVLRIPPAGR